jgi:hypothetical protein
MIEFVRPDLVDNEIYGRLNACREKTIRSKRSDKIRRILAAALRDALAVPRATAPKLHPTPGSTIHVTSKRSLRPLSVRAGPRAESARHKSPVHVGEPYRLSAPDRDRRYEPRSSMPLNGHSRRHGAR